MSTTAYQGGLANSDTRRRDQNVLYFWSVSSITQGDTVVFDSTVRTYVGQAEYGVKTAPAGAADNASWVGVADETITASTTAPALVKVLLPQSFAYKIKVGAGITAGNALVMGTTAGQLVAAAAGDVGGKVATAWSATNTLIDGTTAAGFVSGWIGG